MEHALAYIFTHLQICSIQIACKQEKKYDKHIYIYSLYIYFQGSIYAYMVCIYEYIAINTLVYQLSGIYIYIYVCYMRPQITMHKPLALQEAAVSMHGMHNRVLQKLLKATIKKHLDSVSTVLTKQHYQLLLRNPT